MCAADGARAVVGIPVYRAGDHFAEALESLLAQSRRDVAFVVVDEGADDAAATLVAEYAQDDPRLTYHRNDERLGLVRNWRRAYELARERHPGAEYFAWGSDHDVWHPRWLGALVDELDAHRDAVLAYPLTVGMSAAGELVRGPWRFETAGVTDRRERFRRTYRGMAAGYMVYGLFRADALARVGVYRSVLLPDRLQMAELSLHGQFRQVDEVLWYRRMLRTTRVTMDYQRQGFFPGRPPLHSHAPWWVQHTAALGWALGVRGEGAPAVGRGRGMAFALRYLPVAGLWEGRRKWQRSRMGKYLAPLRPRRLRRRLLAIAADARGRR